MLGAPLGKTAVAYVTHMELQSEQALRSQSASSGGLDGYCIRATNVFEWLRQLLAQACFYKRKENFLVSVKDILTSCFYVILCVL